MPKSKYLFSFFAAVLHKIEQSGYIGEAFSFFDLPGPALVEVHLLPDPLDAELALSNPGFEVGVAIKLLSDLNIV